MMIREEDFRKEAVRFAAYLMAISARTAPKSKGEDDIEIIYVEGEEKDKIANKMIELGKERGKGWIRDGESVKKAEGILIIGVNGGKPLGLNCGACGYNCDEMKKIERRNKDYVGPNCIFKILDLGIALGSAVKLASIINVDNRIIYRIGVVARMLGICNADVVLGIPLASLGKNPFFDRK
ncbi:MAG TPA: hypothetical protein EYH04_00405 [Archaeoglobus profundus]|nr:hypothetical protein [Archaeoglobus profundus]